MQAEDVAGAAVADDYILVKVYAAALAGDVATVETADTAACMGRLKGAVAGAIEDILPLLDALLV